MFGVKEIINDASYLLDSQKRRLIDDLPEEKQSMVIVDLRDMVFNFIETVIGINKADLSATDMTKIDAWLAREE